MQLHEPGEHLERISVGQQENSSYCQLFKNIFPTLNIRNVADSLRFIEYELQRDDNELTSRTVRSLRVICIPDSTSTS